MSYLPAVADDATFHLLIQSFKAPAKSGNSTELYVTGISLDSDVVFLWVVTNATLESVSIESVRDAVFTPLDALISSLLGSKVI